MGCNCGKKPKKLNNLDSMDHLMFASEIYSDIVLNKPREEWDQIDEKQLINGYMTLYPNQKINPSLDVAIQYLREAHQKYISQNGRTVKTKR